MKTFQSIVGRIVFWLFWPIIFLILRDTTRSRVIIESNGEILLISRWYDGFNLSLPGGGVNKNESIENSAIREVYEETGVILENSKLINLNESEYNQYGIKFKLVNFGYSLEPRQAVNKSNIEVISANWFNMKNINQQMVDAQTWQTLQSWKQYISQF